MLPIAAGGAVALLAIGGAATLIGRRRRRREQEEANAQTMAYEPFETAAVAEPAAESEPVAAAHREEAATADRSAFAWGNQQPAATPARASQAVADDDDDRRPGETWVERAYRGPSPSNPSVSLRNRLSRAAFFDKREREVAAGLAEPVDPTAGLPEAAVEEQRELA